MLDFLIYNTHVKYILSLVIFLKLVVKKTGKFRFLFKFFVFSVFLYVLFSIFSQFCKVRKKEEELSSLTSKAQVLDGKLKELSSSLELTEDQIRRVARNSLGMLQKNERVFVVSGG